MCVLLTEHIKYKFPYMSTTAKDKISEVKVERKGRTQGCIALYSSLIARVRHALSSKVKCMGYSRVKQKKSYQHHQLPASKRKLLWEC